MRRISGALAMTMVLAAAGTTTMAQSPHDAAVAEVTQAIDAMGGEAALLAIASISLDVVGHNFAIEQSERPEGPWLTVYHQGTITRDYAKNRLLSTSSRRFWSSPDWSTPVTTVALADVAGLTDGEHWRPAQASALTARDEAFALAPERLLLTARQAPDLRTLPDETMQHVRQQMLAFTWHGIRMRARPERMDTPADHARARRRRSLVGRRDDAPVGTRSGPSKRTV